ncbi:hypothetical protein IKF85_01520 [Candidatus Saccharibacteria bacterium]|nr:hypothetical protein [Candidatus Saccharibacteria bacterium]
MNSKIKAVAAVILLGGLLFSGLTVSAIDTSNMGQMMTISPPVEKMVLIPGEVYEGSVKVSNSATAKKNLEYSVRVGSFSLREDENGETDYYNTDVDTITGYNQIMEWITLGKEKGSVAPNEIDVVPYTITVPKDAPAGGQYASIIIRNDTQPDEDEGNVVIQNVVEFAESILAEVAGETRDEGAIIENNIPAFLLKNNLSAVSKVRNNGNVHTNAKYILQVWPLFSDEEYCTNEEEPSESLIMPETERTHAEECSLPAVGIFRAKQTVKIFGETSIAEKMVIVCPLWLLFIILFAVALAIIWLVMKARARSKES